MYYIIDKFRYIQIELYSDMTLESLKLVPACPDMQILCPDATDCGMIAWVQVPPCQRKGRVWMPLHPKLCTARDSPTGMLLEEFWTEEIQYCIQKKGTYSTHAHNFECLRCFTVWMTVPAQVCSVFAWSSVRKLVFGRWKHSLIERATSNHWKESLSSHTWKGTHFLTYFTRACLSGKE